MLKNKDIENFVQSINDNGLYLKGALVYVRENNTHHIDFQTEAQRRERMHTVERRFTSGNRKEVMYFLSGFQRGINIK